MNTSFQNYSIKMKLLLCVAAFAVGEGIGILIIGAGLLLTLTLIGALIGIPLIFIGGIWMLFVPFMSTIMFFARYIECPSCSKKLMVFHQSALTCQYCKKRIIITKQGVASVVS